MSSSDFRHIAIKNDPGRPDRLFRAAASAFCSLTRPSRREIEQLEDLALPLLPSASVEARRFVAAALSECAYPPANLVRRLAAETVDIAAPLLIRSVALTDVDLIALIGRAGLPHARAIARRRKLNPTIAALIRALQASADAEAGVPVNDQPAEPATAGAAEGVRRRLRSFMRPARPPADRSTWTARPAGAAGFARLLDTALSGNPALFHTALADLLDIGLPRARDIAADVEGSELAAAFGALRLNEEQAFLLAALLSPARFDSVERIRGFVEACRAHLGTAAATSSEKAQRSVPKR